MLTPTQDKLPQIQPNMHLYKKLRINFNMNKNCLYNVFEANYLQTSFFPTSKEITDIQYKKMYFFKGKKCSFLN